jgi:triacylglycerol lipase
MFTGNRSLLRGIAGGILCLALGGASALPAAAAERAAVGPLLTASTSELASSVHCPASFTRAHEPVLLVHGLLARGEWSSTYARVLPRLGYDVCTVDLVDEARGDIQLSAEHVVHAIRTIHQRTGSRVQVIGHSEGPLEVHWAIRWWPDIRFLVDDLISLAAPYHGWLGTELFCASSSCVPALWQMRARSKFMGVANTGDETPGPASYTSVVQPYRTAHLEGASNIAIQHICPGRLVEHTQMVFDAVAFAAVMDALTHPGDHGDAGRVDRSSCLQTTMAGVGTPDFLAGELDSFTNTPPGLAEHQVSSEPPLAQYAHG